MATVYLALDERLDREVALKVMREHLVHDESFVTRFRREARSAASLSHPNVVAVYDQGRDGDVMFLVMEHVPGLTLREVMREEGPLSPRAALDVLEPVLLALGEAHAGGLIHRDVKPENVIINDNGTVKVADFGLARAVTSQTVTSTSGVLLGTVAYLSPEQVERGVADARSDVYAAGLMLFEMLTGTKAVDAATPPSTSPTSTSTVGCRRPRAGCPASTRRSTRSSPPPRLATPTTDRRMPPPSSPLLRRTRASLSPRGPDARPSGTDAVAAASLPTATAALPMHPAPAEPPRPAASRRARTPTPGRSPCPRSRRRPSRVSSSQVAAAPPVVGNRRWWPAIVASALIAALTAWFFILGPGAMATVPSVEGRTQAEAVDSRAARPTCPPQVTEAFDESVPKDQVISTDPAAGDTIRRGAEVSLVVSKGPERYEVPPVVGMTLAEATTRIEEVNLTVGDVREVFHESVPDGQVITAEPGPGASLKKGTAVEMTVSKGRKPIEVPDQTGKERHGRHARAREARPGGRCQGAAEQRHRAPRARSSARARATAPCSRATP